MGLATHFEMQLSLAMQNDASFVAPAHERVNHSEANLDLELSVFPSKFLH